ncbi:hypothetical protein F0U61_07590 [Archangium violaceum]|uniref:hypothetical protein n=1 Tax=Archangium violaceum TaxID=83451 RepID=UPI002B296C0F|nr:hypothetical protein F0U61_07590 [Archangium violaceum]
MHRSINAVWTAFRSMQSPVRAADVDEVVAIVDRHFGGWYNTVYVKSSEPMLAEARAAAIAEVRQLVHRLSEAR